MPLLLPDAEQRQQSLWQRSSPVQVIVLAANFPVNHFIALRLEDVAKATLHRNRKRGCRIQRQLAGSERPALVAEWVTRQYV